MIKASNLINNLEKLEMSTKPSRRHNLNASSLLYLNTIIRSGIYVDVSPTLCISIHGSQSIEERIREDLSLASRITIEPVDILSVIFVPE
jgi:hypothetical protein